MLKLCILKHSTDVLCVALTPAVPREGCMDETLPELPTTQDREQERDKNISSVYTYWMKLTQCVSVTHTTVG